ncbi:hypothetical protein BN1221_04138c [Brenneria goodwinii]|uniref:Uncharacterized protein n=1 Tax=Brenneria goodwinii TaxID=1109412 RepID=A0A0G4K0K6_9GAMM|nr:hypothetical protein BN1221_04138c [Brenneria goodwinii]
MYEVRINIPYGDKTIINRYYLRFSLFHFHEGALEYPAKC